VAPSRQRQPSGPRHPDPDPQDRRSQRRSSRRRQAARQSDQADWGTAPVAT